MTPHSSPDRGGSGLPPQESGSPVVAPASTASSVEYAVQTLGHIINVAFSDALRIDQLARQITVAFGDLDFDERIELGESYGALVEGLLLLENAIGRIDDRG